MHFIIKKRAPGVTITDLLSPDGALVQNHRDNFLILLPKAIDKHLIPFMLGDISAAIPPRHRPNVYLRGKLQSAS